jgi:hypothetical protein
VFVHHGKRLGQSGGDIGLASNRLHA